MVHAYHVIFGAYGFWLPNDPRGSWSDVVRSWELRRFGPATKTNARRSAAGDCDVRRWKEAANQALLYPPVVLTGLQAQSVAHGFANAVRKSKFTIWACSILPEHVHLVIARPQYRIETAVGLIKGEATKQLIIDGLHPLRDYRNNRDEIPTPGEAKMWKVFLNCAGDITRSVQSVDDNPDKEDKPRQHWSFVAPFHGLETRVPLGRG